MTAFCWGVQVLDDFVKASGSDEKPGYFLGNRKELKIIQLSSPCIAPYLPCCGLLSMLLNHAHVEPCCRLVFCCS